MLPAHQAAAIHWTKQAQFGWIKQQVRWNAFEPAPGRYDAASLQALDSVVAAAEAAGLKVLLSVAAVPYYYAAGPGRPHYVPDQLAQFLTMLATRYRGHVHAYEPWNEPNLMGEGALSRLWPEGPAELVAIQTIGLPGDQGSRSCGHCRLPGAGPDRRRRAAGVRPEPSAGRPRLSWSTSIG